MIPARVLVGVFMAFIAAAPFVLPEFQVALLNYIGLATMVSLGLVLLTGVAGVMSFGQQVFAGIAAYTTALITTKYGGSPWLALIIGLLLVAVVALFLGAITLRLSGHYLPISTIAWGIAIYFVFGNLDALNRYSGGAQGQRHACPVHRLSLRPRPTQCARLRREARIRDELAEPGDVGVSRRVVRFEERRDDLDLFKWQ